MSVIADIRHRLASLVSPTEIGDPENRALNAGNLWPSFGVFDAGRTLPTLGPRASFRLAAVNAAVQLLSQEVATLPLKVFNVEGGRRVEAPRHPAYKLLRWTPNPLYTAYQWRETAQIHICLWGNSFTEIVFDSAGRPRQLWLLEPEKMGIMTDDEGRAIMYEYQPTNGDRRLIPPDRMIHIRWLTSETGLVGESPVIRCANAVSLTQATEEFASKFYGSGAHLSGVLSHPGTLTDTSFDALKQSWKESHEGNKSAHSVAILEEGMTWTPTSVNPEDGQMLPTREFQLREVARIFGVPVFRIGGASDTNTYSNIEQETIAFYRNSMRPILTNWEQEINLKLLSNNFEADFDLTDVLRPDLMTRYNGYASAIGAGWLTKNEVRVQEGLPPDPALDVEVEVEPAVVAQEDEDDDELRAFEPVLVATVERVLTRQRHALDEADEGKALRFFEGQAHVWTEALGPVFRSARLAGVIVPESYARDLGERFTDLHAVDATLCEDVSNGLWNAADLTEEILSGLRKKID